MSSQPGNTDYAAWRDRLARANEAAFWPIETLDAELASGMMQFWCDGSAALVTQVVAYPGGALALEAVAGAGDAEAMIASIEPEVAAWARGQGVTHLRVAGRLGWLKRRPEGWKAEQVILVKELNDGHG